MLTFRSGALFVILSVHRFIPGTLIVSAGVTQLEQQGRLFAATHLANHLKGEWGVVDRHERSRNETALRDGGCLVSRYHVAGDRYLCIITKADRSATWLHLDSESLIT
ncbi:hypothetical protein PQR66_09305 [Paraburkholderia agricolaris]|uniref:Uncharacterized protein n=1 Tax=Paraburkholderia agricolaris TaxID=2152888 RepID=A0ABW8ZL86_9BURK